MALQITGKVFEVGASQQVTDKLKKRILIVEIAENAQYPEYIPFEAVNDRCALLDELRAGDEVEVHFNLRGRPYTDKSGKKTYFGSNGIWKINILKTTATPSGGYTVAEVPDLDDPDAPF
jgi:hypothetical protein